MNILIKPVNGKRPRPVANGAMPKSFVPKLLDKAEHQFFAEKDGSTLLQELITNGFTVGYHNFFMKRAKDILISYNEPCVVLQYMLDKTRCAIENVNGGIQSSDSSFLYYAQTNQILKVHLNSGPQAFFQVQFPFSLLKKLPLNKFQFPADQDPDKKYFSGSVEISKRIQFIIKRTIEQSSASAIPVFYLNHRCLALLDQFVKDLSASEQLQRWVEQKRGQLDLLRSEIDANLAEPVHLRSLLPAFIKKMNVSVYQFNKISLVAFGMTIPAFIKTRRMQKAMELLIKANMPVGDICVFVGYDEFSTFSRAFTKHFGHPPSYYRRTI